MASGYYNGPTAGTPGVAASAKDYWSKQALMVYADAATRAADAALTAVLREGMVSFLVDVNTLQVYSGSAWSTIGPVHGALTAWTPTITQSGAVTKTVTAGTYRRDGRWVECEGFFAITGSGTGNNIITVDLPFTAKADGIVLGTGFVNDTSASNNFTAIVKTTSSGTKAYFVATSQFGGLESAYILGNGSSGASVQFALASGDSIGLKIGYECTSDA